MGADVCGRLVGSWSPRAVRMSRRMSTRALWVFSSMVCRAASLSSVVGEMRPRSVVRPMTLMCRATVSWSSRARARLDSATCSLKSSYSWARVLFCSQEVRRANGIPIKRKRLMLSENTLKGCCRV